ncbi:MAG: hypothetical protein J7L15_00215 [Clostridiales bacterium]|nr:hypothetical protein [Clostridiales bacterium]
MNKKDKSPIPIQDLASSKAVVKYLTILFRGSNKFNKYKEEYSKKHKFNSEGINEFLYEILDEFYIPRTSKDGKVDNSSYLLGCLYLNDTYCKIEIHNYIGRKKLTSKDVIHIDKPCIILKINDQINYDEWKDYWNQYIKPKNELLKKFNNLSFLNIGNLRKPYNLRNPWKDIDFYLWIYRLHEEKGYNFDQIKKTYSTQRKSKALSYFNTQIYTVNEIRKKYNIIRNLLIKL